MMIRSNLLRGVGRHTFIVVVHGGSDGGGVWHHRPTSSTSTSLRVMARLRFAIAGRHVDVLLQRYLQTEARILCLLGVITGFDAIDHSSSRHYARLGDGDLCGCRLGFVIEQLALAKSTSPLNLFI
jgi:hypothetical protein